MNQRRERNKAVSKSWQNGRTSESQSRQESPMIAEDIYKVVVIGAANVGKTAVIRALCGDEFSPSKIKTFGIDFRRKLFSLGSRRVKANIWDTCFAQSYLHSLPNTLKGCDGVVIVFDKSKEETFEMVRQAMRITEECTEDAVPILIVGNKVDLGEYETVGEDIKHIILGTKRTMQYRDVNACTGDMVSEAFRELMKAILKTAHIASDSRKSYRDTRNTLTRASTSTYALNDRAWRCCWKT